MNKWELKKLTALVSAYDVDINKLNEKKMEKYSQIAELIKDNKEYEFAYEQIQSKKELAGYNTIDYTLEFLKEKVNE